jgi:putative oxidoreductase
MKLFRLIMRVLIGALFVGHGTQKLFGWFGGHGVEATGGFFESLGLRPGKRNAIAAGASEAGGGALLAAGLATQVAAVLIAAVLGLVEAGPGDLSLDHALGIERSGLGWALFALGAGTAGSLAVSYLGQATEPEPTGVPFQRAPETEPAQQAEQAVQAS